MELNYLRYFFEVARAGSFTEASRRLRISQSALSKCVGLLEHREGVQLLSRSKKGVALTEVGEEVFLKCERLFAIESEIEATCRGSTEVCQGLMSVGASDHIANHLLMPLLVKFQKTYPLVLPRVVAGAPYETVQGLLKNELELGLFFTRVKIPGVVYEVLATLPMAVVAHPRLKDRNRFIVSPRSLPMSSSYMRELCDDPKIVLEASSQENQKRYCLAGGGVAYLVRFMVEDEIRRGRLVEIQLKKPRSVDLHLVRRKGRQLPLSAMKFVEILKAELSV